MINNGYQYNQPIIYEEDSSNFFYEISFRLFEILLILVYKTSNKTNTSKGFF